MDFDIKCQKVLYFGKICQNKNGEITIRATKMTIQAKIDYCVSKIGIINLLSYGRVLSNSLYESRL